ncbi:MAG: Poly(A) polymerase I [Chlamydiae bacterium]|nr:Poly(A) polymerase I [Chlamydiota bacterium]
MQPVIYLDENHPISEDRIDPDALKVIHRLKKHDFSAYLVGGSVRDLLLGITPKDFDISTNAKPEEIKTLFRNCLLIGRRFRLAHIRFGPKVFEVSTFRSGDPKDDNFIVNDNEFGTEEQDAKRRDFTINGLLYDPEEHAIIDYVHGLKDVDSKLLRTIGDPVIRFKQDPIRMIRLLKFKARLNFDIEQETDNAIRSNIQEIKKSSPDRVLGEVFKMLETKATSSFFELLMDYGFIQILFPHLSNFLGPDLKGTAFKFLEVADNQEIYQPEKNILLACFLYPILEKKIQIHYIEKDRIPHLGDIFDLTRDLIKDTLVLPFPRFPRWMRETIAFILNSQFKLTPIDPKKRSRKHKLMGHKKFSLALRFLGLRAHLDERCAREYAKIKRLKK